MTDTAALAAAAYTCERCGEKPAEVLVASEQDGGMSYDAWPLCLNCHLDSVRETFENAVEGGAPIQVMVVARVADVTSAESVERQMKRLNAIAVTENRRIEAERLYNELQATVEQGNAAARSSTAALAVWDNLRHTLTVEQMHTAMHALATEYNS